MNDYNYLKTFENESLNLLIEFSLLNNKYVAHKIFRNGRFVFLRALNSYEHSFFRECHMCYVDFLKLKGINVYGGVRNDEI